MYAITALIKSAYSPSKVQRAKGTSRIRSADIILEKKCLSLLSHAHAHSHTVSTSNPSIGSEHTHAHTHTHTHTPQDSHTHTHTHTHRHTHTQTHTHTHTSAVRLSTLHPHCSSDGTTNTECDGHFIQMNLKQDTGKETKVH